MILQAAQKYNWWILFDVHDQLMELLGEMDFEFMRLWFLSDNML